MENEIDNTCIVCNNFSIAMHKVFFFTVLRELKMATCSFQEAIGGKSITCGNNIKVSTNEVVPLLACTKPIATHLSNYHIDPKTVESEGKLLQLRGGLYFDDIDSLTICPNHRQKLGLGWTCGKFCSLSYCCGKNKSMPKGTISRDQALYLFFKENRFVGVGAGMIFYKFIFSIIENSFFKVE